MLNFKKLQLMPIAVIMLSFATGSLMAESTTGQPSSPADDTSGQQSSMGQPTKPIPRSKDAYGATGSAQPSQAMEAMKDGNEVEAKKQEAVKTAKEGITKPKPAKVAESNETMKPIRVNPNPAGTAVVDTKDTPVKAEATPKKPVDPMDNHKDSDFMIGNDKTIKPIDDDKASAPVTIDSSDTEKAWWQW